MTNGNPPTGKMSSKPRTFDKIVADVRHATFAVMRSRPQGATFNNWVVGSGFFVSKKIFLTCAHLFILPANPHVDGDTYHLISRSKTTQTHWTIQNGILGQNIRLFGDADLALLTVDEDQDKAYLPLEYADIPEGAEIGVAGYPIPVLQSVNGQINLNGLIYRVARNVLTATYVTSWASGFGPTLTNIPVLEVNFLFVPGNSGGPIFSATNGRVIGYVQGFRTHKVEEKIETAEPNLILPAGLSNTYIRSNSALYSVGIGLGRVRTYLEGLGVTL
jgi:S1-C subfamily serine protease